MQHKTDAGHYSDIDAFQPQCIKRQKLFDRLLNIALVLAACISILIYALPIFGNQLYAPRGTHYFGVVKTGTQIHQNFTVRNLHPWTVVVSGIQSDCGCTESFTGKNPPFLLSPFQSVVVTASLDISGKKGAVNQKIQVITSDNQQGTSLLLQGKVQ